MLLNGFKNIAAISLETDIKLKQLGSLLAAPAPTKSAPATKEVKAEPKKEEKKEEPVDENMGDMFGGEDYWETVNKLLPFHMFGLNLLHWTVCY